MKTRSADRYECRVSTGWTEKSCLTDNHIPFPLTERSQDPRKKSLNAIPSKYHTYGNYLLIWLWSIRLSIRPYMAKESCIRDLLTSLSWLPIHTFLVTIKRCWENPHNRLFIPCLEPMGSQDLVQEWLKIDQNRSVWWNYLILAPIRYGSSYEITGIRHAVFMNPSCLEGMVHQGVGSDSIENSGWSWQKCICQSPFVYSIIWFISGNYDRISC